MGDVADDVVVAETTRRESAGAWRVDRIA